MTGFNSDLQGQLLVNERLAKYTSWRVGGLADQMYLPANKEDLVLFISRLPEASSIIWLGLGSNLLIRDGGVRGTVIHTLGHVREIYALSETSIYVESGVPCAHVARFCAGKGLSGAEFLAGIPGTMGGALKMNAGAFGGETWELVESVEMMLVGGVIEQRKADAFEVSYRSVKGVGGRCFLSAVLKLTKEAGQGGTKKIKEFLAQRAISQPVNQPSCGSVFRNPVGEFAARLIEQSGLKGYTIGGAQVSEKHANFIVNTGSAKSVDIEQLIAFVQSEVMKKQGVQLQTEVCIIGEFIP